MSIVFIAATFAAFGRVVLKLRPTGPLFGWCLAGAAIHCVTDSLYWWGVKPLWPFSEFEVTFSILEYLDLIVLGIWLLPAFLLWKLPERRTRTAATTFVVFSTYILLRSVLPAPSGLLHFSTGGWMYAAPQRTPVLD